MEKNIEHVKELTLQDLMQMSHDMEELQKDFDMFMEFMDVHEIKTILRKDVND